jgi:ABC-type lipoprotein export system ATPase subunit
MLPPCNAISKMTTHYSPKGSLWHRWDLHFHTPASFDYLDKSASNQQIVDKLIECGIRVVAITDHHFMDVDRIHELQRLGGERLTVLPGIELRADHGGDPIHYICIFPENCNLPHVWTTLQGSLGLTPQAIEEKGGDEKIYVPIENGASEARRLGGVVSIHAGKKSNSIEEIKNEQQFQHRIKFDITKKWVDILEIGQLKDIEIHHKVIFPATNLKRPLLICSDNHKISDYSTKSPMWLKADPTFRGLLMVLREPDDRVFIGERPEEFTRFEQNPTKYIESVAYERKANAPEGEKWFTGSISFNPGLIAIIGNKGSGKSALADTLGLLGASKNEQAFSFLSSDRFRRQSSSLAQHFDATIRWASGDEITRCLNDQVPPNEVERLKYLPQDHVEKVCNELAGTGQMGFEKELKSVIFSHVPQSSRLGQSNLDDLVRFQTGEKQKRIDTLIRQIKEVSRLRATLEAQANPDSKRELNERVKQRSLEIEAHDRAKPTERKNPADDPGNTSPNPDLIKSLEATESEKKSLEGQISQAQETVRIEERKHAVVKRLIEKLDNFAKEFIEFKSGLVEDSDELGLKVDNLINLKIEKLAAEHLRDTSAATISNVKSTLSGSEEGSLVTKLNRCISRIADAQSKLDAPYREYQAYLKELEEWQAKRSKLVGQPTDPDSLMGLQAALAGFEEIPAKIAASQAEQIKLALEIHQQKIAQGDVYRALYQPVQEFIDKHKLAQNKLKLEFRAELTDLDFANRLLGMLSLNRRGSFMGVDDGRARVENLTKATRWDVPESVEAFLKAVDTSLHTDQREASAPEVQLRDQLSKGKKSEDVFDLVYGLEYTEPRYILRWEGKDLIMLSPGERGTLLLAFYLLLDKGDMPLVIDQPEGNLDNHTVAKVLVDCIREARKRRQVFIVTHNPNLAVVCDADQVVHAKMDKSQGNTITYESGSLENPEMSSYVTDVLEGTRWAFDVRGNKYKVCE